MIVIRRQNMLIVLVEPQRVKWLSVPGVGKEISC